jgi:ferredoxin-NADP reductase
MGLSGGQPWTGHDIYLCGSDRMVADTYAELVAAGVRPEAIHYESFFGPGGDPYGFHQETGQ